jgi:hypothetical protein
MFVERRLNAVTNTIELWSCDWENQAGQAARKIFIQKIGDEQPLMPDGNAMSQASAICWSYGRTLGNIAVFTQSMLGSFNGKAGSDATLPCDFVHAGKFRHGVARWWCRTHQSHWGTKGDIESYERSKIMVCANHDQLMNYVVDPFRIDLNEFAEVGIWCSMPPAISSQPIARRPPQVHVHLRPDVGGKKSVDRDFPAISIKYGASLGLFGNVEITEVNITPPAAFQFVCAFEFERKLDCINCSSCGYPHLDLGDFAERPHRKHFCANCGRDSTWSSAAIISTPLKPLHDRFTKSLEFESPDRRLNLDDFPNCDYKIWASTPAILWTADRPQEKGVHVHVQDGSKRVIDDTYGEVVLDGKALVREELLQQMLSRTIT